MAPEFWTNLPAILTAANIILVTIIGVFSHRKAKKLDSKIDANTNVTMRGQQAIYEKVDSSTKEVKENTVLTAKVAANVAIQATEATSAVLAQTQKIVEKADKIENKLNGGPGGLQELNNRVTHLEQTVDALTAGQNEILQVLKRNGANG